MIAPETLNAIRSRLDIAEVVREHVPELKRAGRNWTARCPFHQEKSPSFTVSPERQTFHCYGCGVHGDVFAFVMKLENLGFTEAVERLAERAGVKLEKRAADFSPEERDRSKMREALAVAREFYHDQLLKSPDAAPARSYLAKRGLSAASLSTFGLGWASGRSGGLLAAAERGGFPPEILIKAGLAARRDGGAIREFFFARVLFPIVDPKGTTVGFGGRTLVDAQPKYINSPEGPVFSKSRVLFGLYQALPAVRKSRRVVLMEGYMDVIASHQHGLAEAVAPLGTALTQEHVTLLARHAHRAVVVFDADSAGRAAATRGGQLLQGAFATPKLFESGLGIWMAALEGGKDPDELLLQSGVEPLKRCLESAVDLPEFATRVALARHGGAREAEEKSQVAAEVLPLIGMCPDEVVKDQWIVRLAERLGVNDEALRAQMRKGSDRRILAPAPAKPAAGVARVPEGERRLLVLLLAAPGLADMALESDWSSPFTVQIWKAARDASRTEPPDSGWSARVLACLDPSQRPWVSGLMHEESPSSDPPADVRDILRRRRREARLRELESLVKKNAASGRADPAVTQEYQQLLVESKGTRRP